MNCVAMLQWRLLKNLFLNKKNLASYFNFQRRNCEKLKNIKAF